MCGRMLVHKQRCGIVRVLRVSMADARHPNGTCMDLVVLALGLGTHGILPPGLPLPPITLLCPSAVHELHEMGLANSTYVLFTSDNG